ncbi:hypothetical protein EV702DRAFT_1215132 [Suillus placidus]|uniref:Uncharacterized protein n=1 Tax=Suillus placidus TaxID=48579 RepID=A0A9P6ZZX9_9AGAM|nr:hypothetical protein EV702DRAFT_1215132 [Suillus placidus]
MHDLFPAFLRTGPRHPHQQSLKYPTYPAQALVLTPPGYLSIFFRAVSPTYPSHPQARAMKKAPILLPSHSRTRNPPNPHLLSVVFETGVKAGVSSASDHVFASSISCITKLIAFTNADQHPESNPNACAESVQNVSNTNGIPHNALPTQYAHAQTHPPLKLTLVDVFWVV